ncbi:MAG: nucleotidyl transferase AbiEii/AbiGii toxin family protein [Bacteroidales bacterium]|nr:nucleotidyl transferase AbiEii/AbiGii toxin family protein [Bacteroidales bacterium]
MILPETFSAEWITGFKESKEFNRMNPPVFEKMIFALSFLESLTETGLEFIFKGGTSLVLLLENFQRFSTDIDIITSQSHQDLVNALTALVATSHFKSFDLDERRSKLGNIPKAHYIVKYNSVFQIDGQIILDVVFEENPYPCLVKSEIKSRWLKTVEPYNYVLTPDINSILGDKLTAFAPNTIGVPYYRNGSSMNTEIIKQLFDISNLINHISNIETAYNSFIKTYHNQLKYRNLNLSLEAIYQDIFETSLLIAKRERNKNIKDKSLYSDLQNGIISFNQFLSNGSFRIENAITASAKVTYFSTILRSKRLDDFQVFNPMAPIFEIKNINFNFLNRLRRTNLEAFFYWQKTLELLNID